LGPARRAALLKHFGSLRKLKSADADAIAALPGFGPRTAAAVLAALHGPDRPDSPDQAAQPDAAPAGQPDAGVPAS
jgi:excinuclease ABC subunit C